MKRITGFIGLLLLSGVIYAQDISKKLSEAFAVFESDSQLKHAISSLYVTDAESGKVVFAKNEETGLAPASTQKVITSVTALELLGPAYRFATAVRVENNELIITASGDPALGSWRWASTKPDEFIGSIVSALKSNKITAIKNIRIEAPGFTRAAIPGGWIWQDIGNYYGAGAHALNWKENQFDLLLKSGDKPGDKVEILDEGYAAVYNNELKTAARGTGDNAYIYLDNLVDGTIPAGEKSFRISGAEKDPGGQFIAELISALRKAGISIDNKSGNTSTIPLVKYTSPSLDSLIYWFNKKSINLYGEALIKAIGKEKGKEASTDAGLDVLKDFWKEQGLDVTALNMSDGSGLSPQNRVTTRSQVDILRYARQRPWFAKFNDALPEYNNMRMKSGTINRVKGFCGYHTSGGKTYVFSFLVNNYNGSASSLVQKMYKVLDVLK
jgi:D-alanyl-D-alanine carboxypeptidase/D-alanyl-D-alanine-endopeptidase (penicillin-binding protein 4)